MKKKNIYKNYKILYEITRCFKELLFKILSLYYFSFLLNVFLSYKRFILKIVVTIWYFTMIHYVPSNVSFSQPSDRSFCNAYMINGDAENIITFSIENKIFKHVGCWKCIWLIKVTLFEVKVLPFDALFLLVLYLRIW